MSFFECPLLPMKALCCAGLLLMSMAGSLVPMQAWARADAAAAAPLVAESSHSAGNPKVASKPVPKGSVPHAKAGSASAQKSSGKSAKRKHADVIATPLPTPRLDLSLPIGMVSGLQPGSASDVQLHRPLLPAMFGEKPKEESPFQLNGRLLSNEMQLQLRNDSRQDVEGAAIEFEFKQ